MIPLPLPTNLFPYWFFPWTTNTWPGFTKYIYHKEILAVDALRQIFVWKDFAFNQISRGNLPLWNPHNFSGQPLLANFQSAVFYPLSWVFLLPSHLAGWSIYILIQPILAGSFMYLFLRGKNLAKLSAVFGALALTFSSFFATRYFWGVCIHTLLWLPLGLYLIDKLSSHKLGNWRFIALETIVISLAILAGYPQFAVFVLLVLFAYFLLKMEPAKLWLLVFSLALGFLVTSIQLLPTIELYQNSLREGLASKEAFTESLLDGKYLVSILSPDFFGSPATNNYSGGKDYSGMNGFFGTIPLILALFALRQFRQNKEIRFWVGVSTLGLLFAYKNPVALLPSLLNIPILGSGGAWSNLFFFQFGGVVLSAFGLNLLLEKRIKSFFLFPVGAFCLLFVVLILSQASPLSIRASIIATAPLLLFFGAYSIFPKKLGIIAVTFVGLSGFYFFQKVSPFGSGQYFFPSHPLITFLQKEAGLNRFWGSSLAKLPSNLSTYYGIYSPEGYDSLFPKWYGELVQTTKNGEIPAKLNRADVFLDDTKTSYQQRLLNLLGVKYILGPDASVKENQDAFPRAYLASSAVVATNVIAKIYDPQVDLRSTVVLEKPIGENFSSGSAKIISYSPNKVTVQTNSSEKSILFLSDTFFPGWKARVNLIPTEILRADYAFRAVIVPKGENEVEFNYEPASFEWGSRFSLLGLLLLACLLFFARSSKHLG